MKRISSTFAMALVLTNIGPFGVSGAFADFPLPPAPPSPLPTNPLQLEFSCFSSLPQISPQVRVSIYKEGTNNPSQPIPSPTEIASVVVLKEEFYSNSPDASHLAEWTSGVSGIDSKVIDVTFAQGKERLRGTWSGNSHPSAGTAKLTSVDSNSVQELVCYGLSNR